MKIARDIGRVFGVVLFIASPTFLTAQETRSKCPPATRADDAKDTYGATVVADPYRWLEDQESKETRAWIDAQDKCTEAALSKLPRRAAIAKRLTELYRIDSYGMPRVENGRYFFPKRLAGQDLSLLCMRKSSGAPDEVLVDPLLWSADHSASANIQNVSKDGRYLFYGRREGGQDEITVHVMDADARKDLPDVLSRAVYFSVEPTKDNAGIYYTKTTAEGPRAYYHAMGTDPAKDTLLFGQKLGKEMILLVQPSEDDNYLCFVVFYGSGSERTEVYVQNLKEHGPIIPVVNDQNSLFFPSWGGDALFLQTNWKAPLWHVYTVDLKNLSHENWREVVPESDIKLEDLTQREESWLPPTFAMRTLRLRCTSPMARAVTPSRCPLLAQRMSRVAGLLRYFATSSRALITLRRSSNTTSQQNSRPCGRRAARPYNRKISRLIKCGTHRRTEPRYPCSCSTRKA